MPKMASSSLLAAWISLISNFLLTLIKVIVGIFFRSTALIADGFHNGGDVIASIATLSSMRVSSQPADEDHPYGHGKAEDISSGIIAVMLIFAGLFLIYESVHSLFQAPAKVSIFSLIAAFISLVWKYILFVYTRKVGQYTHSKSLLATSKDHLADVYASLAAVIGIGFGFFGDLFNVPFAVYGDPIAGILVSLLILKVALEMGIESVNVLMESNVSPEKQEDYRSLIMTFEEVKRIDRLRAREHGNYVLIDVRISLPGDMTIKEGHDITKSIRNKMMSAHDNVEEVLIHVNPWYENSPHVHKN